MIKRASILFGCQATPFFAFFINLTILDFIYSETIMVGSCILVTDDLYITDNFNAIWSISVVLFFLSHFFYFQDIFCIRDTFRDAGSNPGRSRKIQDVWHV